MDVLPLLGNKILPPHTYMHNQGLLLGFLFSFRASRVHSATPETPSRQNSLGRSSLPLPQDCGVPVEMDAHVSGCNWVACE